MPPFTHVRFFYFFGVCLWTNTTVCAWRTSNMRLSRRAVVSVRRRAAHQLDSCKRRAVALRCCRAALGSRRFLCERRATWWTCARLPWLLARVAALVRRCVWMYVICCCELACTRLAVVIVTAKTKTRVSFCERNRHGQLAAHKRGAVRP